MAANRKKGGSLAPISHRHGHFRAGSDDGRLGVTGQTWQAAVTGHPFFRSDAGEGWKMNRDASTGAATVLVVDEEPIILDMISEELTRQGFSVLVAETGEAALSIIKSNQRVDLLFTDIWLPEELDGWRLAETARQTRPKLVVIYVTGYTVERGKAVPGSIFLKKPYRPSEIVATIRTLIAPDDCPTDAALRPL